MHVPESQLARGSRSAGRAIRARRSLLKERSPDDLVVHGPVVIPVDEAANRRFARIVSAREQARQPKLPLARLGTRRAPARTR